MNFFTAALTDAGNFRKNNQDGILVRTDRQRGLLLAAREARRGKMTALEAQRDKRRNLLLQCVGASARVEPEIKTGSVRPGINIICSDGFCNKITDKEIAQAFDPAVIESRDDKKKAGKTLIERARLRGEEDNMSFAAVKVAEI